VDASGGNESRLRKGLQQIADVVRSGLAGREELDERLAGVQRRSDLGRGERARDVEHVVLPRPGGDLPREVR
jgi:hypothetical protein